MAGNGGGDVSKLTGHEKEWRLRVGGYRVLFSRNDAERLIIVLHVLPRSRAYRR
jgi:mRNA-degrading endonuclease RelE of RelBE toxin-antitoxin system